MNDTTEAEQPKEYRLGSSALIYAPGVVAWAINGYAFPRDQTHMVTVMRVGWNLPEDVAVAVLSKAVPYTVEGDVVVFWA